MSLTLKVRFYQAASNLQKLAARALRFIPVVPKILGISGGRIYSVKKWVEKQRISSRHTSAAPEYHVIYEPMTIVPLEPKCPTGVKVPEPPALLRESSYHFNYWDIRSGYDSTQGLYHKSIQDFGEVFLTRIPDGFVLGPSGAVLDPDRKLFVESIWAWDDWLNGDRSQKALWLPSPKRIDEPCYIVASNDSEGYPHWLMEVLPRLFGLTLLPSGEKPVLIFKAELKRWQIDSLELLGFGGYPRLSLNDQFFATKTLYFPGYVGQPGTPHPTGCQWVRENIMSKLETGGEPKRIYITRRFATKRKLLNEEAILPILKEYDFEVIVAEKLSFADQVMLFSKAEAVVAAHGAGLANLLWVPMGCKVLEVLDRDYVSDYFYNLSSILGLDYYYQLCASVNADSGLPLTRGRDNITIDPEKFKTSLEVMFGF